MAEFLIGAVIMLIIVAIFSLVGALLVMLASRLIAQTGIGFGKAFGLTFVVYIIGSLAELIMIYVLGYTLETAPEATFSLPSNIGYAATLAFGAFWYGRGISDAQGRAIGVVKGLLIALVAVAFLVALGLLFENLLASAG